MNYFSFPNNSSIPIIGHKQKEVARNPYFSQSHVWSAYGRARNYECYLRPGIHHEIRGGAHGIIANCSLKFQCAWKIATDRGRQSWWLWRKEKCVRPDRPVDCICKERKRWRESNGASSCITAWTQRVNVNSGRRWGSAGFPLRKLGFTVKISPTTVYPLVADCALDKPTRIG